MQRLITFAAICIAAHAVAQPRLPATTQADLHHLIALAAKEPNAGKLTAITHQRYPTAMMHGRCMVGFLGKVVPGALPVVDEHIAWGARVGDIVSFRVDIHHLDRLNELTGVAYVELAGMLRPSLDKVVRATRADSVHQGINLPQSYTGRNVLIGIPDFGFEYAHPMFHDTALTATRIRAAWDMSKQSGPAPSGYAYGTLHGTPEEVVAAVVDTAEADGHRDTHGTHVAGIAGGGGAGTAYRGIAFDARYLLASMFHDFASALDAIHWMRQVAQAEQQRLVVNMSWASILEFSDGTSLFAQALDLLADQGVLLVAAAGNFGGGQFHVRHDFVADTVRTRVRFTDPGTDSTIMGQRLMLLGDPGQPFSAALSIRNTSNALLLQTPWMHTDMPTPFADSVFVVGSDSVHVRVVAEAAHPGNGRPYLRMDVDKTGMGLRVDLNMAAPSGTVHAWNAVWWPDETGWYDLGFQAAMPGYKAGNDDYGVGDPACAAKVLTVGAYSAEFQTGGGTWVGGAGAAFSSKGPTLDGRLKPEITAPGVNVMSSINGYNTQGIAPLVSVTFQGGSYGFHRDTGTSMAAPVVTGIAALLLEAMPLATPAEIKQIIMDNARTDNHTGIIPPQGSNVWGMGKVHAYRSVVDLLGVVGVPEKDAVGYAVWPNPTSGSLHVLNAGAAANMRYELLDITGRCLQRGPLGQQESVIDLRAFSTGTYLLRISGSGLTVTQRVCRE